MRVLRIYRILMAQAMGVPMNHNLIISDVNHTSTTIHPFFFLLIFFRKRGKIQSGIDCDTILSDCIKP